MTEKHTLYFMVIGGVVFLAILWLLLVGLKSETPKTIVEYNYFTFEEIGGLWQTTINLEDQLYVGVFRFNPEQVKDLEISGDSSRLSQPIYITFDPDSDEEQFKYLALATAELSLHLIRAFDVSVIAACTKNETDACIDRPIVNCGDPDKSVIYLVAKPPTQVALSDKCVALWGHNFDLLKSVDRFLFRWYKIMQ